MVFGDNVRARRAARALPRTPTQRGREEEERGERKTSDETTHPHRYSTHHTLFYPTQTPTAIPQ